MLLKEMINKYPEHYIAVAHLKKGVDNLIQTATVLKVYPTLREAYSNIKEIKLFMNRYADFDIVYGDYDDYVSTRRKMIVVPDKEILTQDEIDNLIALLELSEAGGGIASPICVDVPNDMTVIMNENEKQMDCMVPTQLDISNILEALSEVKNE